MNLESVAPPPIEARLVEPAPVEVREEKPAAVPKAMPVEKKFTESKMQPVPASVPAVPAPQAAALPVASLNPATINDYRAQLLGAAGRFKRYPEEARENNWTGDVVVGVAVGATGAAQVGLRRSSGHAVLDRQALEMFQQAARTVPLPEALRGREFRLDLRAVYGLED